MDAEPRLEWVTERFYPADDEHDDDVSAIQRCVLSCSDERVVSFRGSFDPHLILPAIST
jgi:hypothetical protein